MTVEEQVKAVERRNVLVAIRIDHRSRELLSWALVKVAEPGDRVVALHVSKEANLEDNDMLGDYLKDYGGLCDVKQVDLSGQTTLGRSVKRVLVREAKRCAAVAVVVGISKQNAFRTWASMARYCARRLSPSTEVLAIYKGKVVFRSCSRSLLPEVTGDPKPSIHQIENSNTKESPSEFGSSEASQTGKSSSEAITRFFSRIDGSGDSREDCLDMFHDHNKVPSRSASLDDLLEHRPGWPLQRSLSMNPQAMEARSLSVVQWVMTLPNRSLPETPQKAEYPSNERESPFDRDANDLTNSSISNLTTAACNELQEELELLFCRNSSTCQWFSYNDLRISTANFSSENLIGKGGCNNVYKGTLPNGKQVAIKVLKSSSEEARRDFVLEVEIVSSLRHKNILPLIGICIENNDLISVYDYLLHGSLEDTLNGSRKESKCILSWEMRYNIAIKVAEALNYIHNECSRTVIHRDVKSSNILLSSKFEPQLSDFGLAIWGPKTSFFLDQGSVFGTFGYLAPEYFMYGKISDKIDVYSFGVVLLELLSGRKSISSEIAKGQESLVIWAKPILEGGDQKGLVDPNLKGMFNEAQVQRMALAAARCLTRTARLRPKISQILKLLKGVKDAEECVNSKFEDDEILGQNDDEAYPASSVESHLSLALRDVDDETTSSSSGDRRNSISTSEHLKDLSRSSSFN